MRFIHNYGLNFLFSIFEIHLMCKFIISDIKNKQKERRWWDFYYDFNIPFSTLETHLMCKFVNPIIKNKQIIIFVCLKDGC